MRAMRIGGIAGYAGALAGCAVGADAGVIQRQFGDGYGGSVAAHAGIGVVPKEILVAELDLRGDVADHNSRFAVGASLLGGLPVFGGRVLGRAGIWKAATSSADERTVVPSFELAGFVPLHQRLDDPHHRYGLGATGVVFGVREDLDTDRYFTIFAGLAVFLVPGP